MCAAGTRAPIDPWSSATIPTLASTDAKLSAIVGAIGQRDARADVGTRVAKLKFVSRSVGLNEGGFHLLVRRY